jgi:hypothetical protein
MASQTLYSSHPQEQQTSSSNGNTTRHKPPALAINGHGNGSASSECPPPAYTPLFPDSDDGVFSEDEADSPGGDLAVLSPSSVTSPPYWSSHTHNHSGGVPPNMSSESVVPGAITLQDNEFDDGPGGANVYGRDRNRACWAKSVQVRDYVLVNGSTTNIGAFAVWNIRVETLNGSHMYIRKRYSEFDDLRRRLIMTFPNFEAAVPGLPPKSVISKFRPKFLEKRRAGLQYFLNCILLNPEFSGSPVLKEFLFS